MRKRGKLRLYWLVICAACVLTAPISIISNPLRSGIQNLVFDQYQRWRPRAEEVGPPVRIIDIDDESIRRIGQWPWPRARMALLLDVLGKSQAAVIGFDLLFSEKERTDVSGPSGAGDKAFARAIANGPVVLGGYFTNGPDGAATAAKAGFATVGDDPSRFLHQLRGVLAPLPSLAENAAGVGFMNWLPDSDRVLRRVPLILNVGGALQPSLAMEVVRVAQGASTYLVKSSNASGETAFGESTGVNAIRNGDAVIPTDAAGDMRVYFARTDPRRAIPAWKIFEEGADLGDLQGKIVLVGASASLLSDVVATPLQSSTPGVEAHAQIIAQILGGTGLRRPDWAVGAEIMATMILILGLAIALPRVSALWCALLGAVAASALAMGSWFAFSRHGILLDPVAPILSSSGVFFSGVLALYGQKRRQEREIREAFGRFVSPAVVARLAENPENLQLGGLARPLTLLFCDIRSFTTLSEGMSATELTRFLNEYLTPMTDAVLDAQGTVDKYMGDAIMAFWNAPLDDPRHGLRAAQTALAMRDILARLNEDWRRRDGADARKVKFGVGLNTGECCVGNLGSARRFDYSAIGDEVNVASRLEGASKIFGVDIVASGATRDESPDLAWLEIDQVVFKNKTLPVGVHALVGDAALAASAGFRDLAQRHAAMLAAYRAKKFEFARIQAVEARELAPDVVAGLYVYFEKRFRALAAMDLGQDWRPVLALDEK